jgi:hypothetical protein
LQTRREYHANAPRSLSVTICNNDWWKLIVGRARKLYIQKGIQRPRNVKTYSWSVIVTR